MNGNQLDDLFKQKLGNHKLTPPPGSWDQIENNLKENKSKGISLWFKIAASFLLILAIGFLIISSNNNTPAETIANSTEAITTDTKAAVPNEPKATQSPIVAPLKEEPIIEIEKAEPNTNRLLAQSVQTNEEDINVINAPFERVALNEIASLKLNSSTPKLLVAKSNHSNVLPLDVSLMHTYSIERNEEVKKSRKFRMLNGIISIAKGVNKSKLGFEDIRNAKNGFVNDELKYGTKETEDVVEDGDTKSDELNK